MSSADEAFDRGSVIGLHVATGAALLESAQAAGPGFHETSARR